MLRVMTLLMLIWGLLAVPALCTAGALLHPCECGAVIGCAHEEQCSEDPCSDLLAPPNNESHDLQAAVAANPACSFIPLVLVEEPVVVSVLLVTTNLPCPTSVLPLLI